ncbi:glyoxylate/hydroxypyruvate reductase A [Herbaspirillum sp. YR522]|uniref:2-hydroxyacid dehydrogenase n=1 Tax=Herbaspirillum sp. YR522 TaxID=1144342 RepID=UPI00026FBC53|nr:glyoxylate/hydroxypyruvate reductase A [Herbaspirillum sp. YR522]EJN02695.1 phosphoglycerate dehydrogenase-like oxidoreductase [Herbaspirillum sp. YR522]
MTTIVYTDRAAVKYAQAIKRIAPEFDICALGDPAAASAEVAVSWAPAVGSYDAMPGLRLIHSVGAGADHIIASAQRHWARICRIVDVEQAQSMAQYVVWGVLNAYREFDVMRAQQKAKVWARVPTGNAAKTVVGIMGMGLMGKTVAGLLAPMGFTVRGWSRRRSEIDGVTGYGEDELAAFLDGTSVLVCLLPLTSTTRHILSRDLYRKLAPGAYLIHVGRGEQLRAGDLVDALDQGVLGGALLDVFPVEPLPVDDPLWSHDKIIVTPHVAAISDADVVAAQIIDNVRRLNGGLPLNNEVRSELGY